MNNAAGCLILFLTLPLSAMWRGYVLSTMWGWFIVTTFGAPPLGIAAAIGLALVAGFLTHQSKASTKDEGEKDMLARVFEALFIAFGGPAMALFTGWIVKHWL